MFYSKLNPCPWCAPEIFWRAQLSPLQKCPGVPPSVSLVDTPEVAQERRAPAVVLDGHPKATQELSRIFSRATPRLPQTSSRVSKPTSICIGDLRYVCSRSPDPVASFRVRRLVRHKRKPYMAGKRRKKFVRGRWRAAG